MVTSCSQYTEPISQFMTDQYAYFLLVSDLAFKALKLCIPRDSMGYFCSLVKQTAEIFPDFLTHFTIAVEKCIPLGPIKDILIKEFT